LHQVILQPPPNIHNLLRFYINLNQIAVGSKIYLEIKDKEIKLDQNEVILSKKHILSDEVAEMAVGYKGSKEMKSKCTVKYENYSDNCKVNIASGEKSAGGLFKGWRFILEDQDFQSYYNPLTGYIEINLNNSINERVFTKDSEDAGKRVNINSFARVLLAQMVLEEALNKIAGDAFEKGKLKGKDKFSAIINYKNGIKNGDVGLGIFNHIAGEEDFEEGYIVAY